MATIPGIPYGPAPRTAPFAAALTMWDLIVIHDTGHHGRRGEITSAPDEAHYAATRTDERKYWTSAHAYIDPAGPIGSLPLHQQAWAAFGWANGRGIHFEMCGENAGSVAAVAPATIAHTAALVRRVADLKGIPLTKLTAAQLGAAARAGTRIRGICGHYDITLGLGVGDHDDPGPAFDWATFMALVNGQQGDDMPDFSADDASAIAFTLLRGPVGPVHAALGNLTKDVAAIGVDVAALKARPAATVDPAALASALIANPAFVAALAGAVAVKTVDEEARRLGNG